MERHGIAIGELSRRTSCNTETIRFYERIGLLPKPSRCGRYRRYGSEDERRLTFVRRARDLGFTLDEVRALLGLAYRDGDACAEAREIAAGHLATVRRKVADLQIMERALVDIVLRCGSGTEPGCPLISLLAAVPVTASAETK